ncbi:hypothetical protein Dvina_01445 [Dactylosporangium vinaceum]|uniref:Uncharacterized protein n=1 Tax=Dactylosporangium vinaceum TaxID=53362 RepID=A0ABV5MLM6_9ACTN|nr:hypothetical protein [Dactylosporangium vinaceum]UAB96923.1 hypothetical protein Dvina_01445 [Dactylosporangium vinaceum]
MSDPQSGQFGQQPYAHPPGNAPWPPPVMPPPQVGPSRRKRRRGAGLWIGVGVAVLLVLAGGAVVAGGVTGKGPAASVFKDSGVAACEQIRDSAAASKASPEPSPKATKSAAESLKAYQAFRKQFADSRYDDLRTAGTEVLDLIFQLSDSGKDSTSDGDAGLAFVAAGQLVQKWATLAGACGNHGVTIPKLTELH